MDAKANLVRIASDLAANRWQKMEKQPKYRVKTKTHKGPEKVKDQVVKNRKFKKIKTISEHIAEFDYQPGKCKKTYRIVVLKKTMKVTKGDKRLEDEIRYFFDITNEMKMSAKQLIQ